MRSKRKQDVPKTIGELRRRLAKLGNPWTVDPQLSDDDPLPDPARGGQRDEEILEESRLAPRESDADLEQLIAAQPPSNPFLRHRWAEGGLLSQDEADGLLPKPSEAEGGAP